MNNNKVTKGKSDIHKPSLGELWQFSLEVSMCFLAPRKRREMG